MVFPKYEYFGRAYRAKVPLRLTRPMKVKDPRTAYNVYNLVNLEVLWYCYKQGLNSFAFRIRE